MTKFTFKKDEFNISENKIDDFVFTDDSIANILKSYLKFIYEKSSIPELPSTIEIIYVEDNKLFQKFGEFFNIESYKKPDHYAYPASMSPGTSTLYLSTDFNQKNNKLSKIKNGIETNEIVLFRRYFNQDNQKALEYTFGHELGHFFLLSKNFTNPELDKNKLIQTIARNIEEGFAEAFSIQLMCLKNPELNFNNVKNGRHHDSAIKLSNKTDKSVSSIQRLDYFTRVGFEKLIDTYNFKTIYDNLPIKDINGNVEQDIGKIYNQCLEIAKKNNKEVLKDIINNQTFKNDGLVYNFNNELKNCIKEEPKIDKLTIPELIDKIQTKITGTSFNTSTMKMLRKKFLEDNLQNIKKFKN